MRRGAGGWGAYSMAVSPFVFGEPERDRDVAVKYRGHPSGLQVIGGKHFNYEV